MSGQNADVVIEGDYMEVDGEGKPVNPQAQSGAAQPGANDNETQDNAESVEERLRIKTYDELDPERREVVDEIIATINVFDLDSIFTLGDGPIDEHNNILEGFIKEQDEHDKEGGIFAEFSAITGVTEESTASQVFRKAKKFVEDAKEVVVDTAVSVREKVGIMARIGGMLVYPLVVASEKFQEWKDGEESKGKKKTRGVRAVEYTEEKAEREQEFKRKHTIPEELKNDILEAAAKERARKEKIETIVTTMPGLRKTFDGLVTAQVIIFDALENYIIASRKEIDTLSNQVIPEQEAEARRIGTQEKRLEVQSIRSGLDRLRERAFTLENFRYNAMIGAVSFEERKVDLERIEGECRSLIANSKITLNRLVNIRYSLMTGQMDQLIAEARQGEIEQVKQDTALNLVLVELYKNKGDSPKGLVDAQEENLLSKQRVSLARIDSAESNRKALEDGRERTQALAEKAARLAAPTEENLARIRQEVAEADVAAERAKSKSSLALDWSARRPTNTGDAPAGQALTPVLPRYKQKPTPKTP